MAKGQAFPEPLLGAGKEDCVGPGTPVPIYCGQSSFPPEGKPPAAIPKNK